MSSGRSGTLPYSFTSFKSNQSYQNYQPQYFGVRTQNQAPKMFSTFNSSGLIQSNHVSTSHNDFKMFPTSTSIKYALEDQKGDESDLNTFKNIMLIAAANKWTQKDILSNWNQLTHLIKNGFKGSKRQLQKQINSHKTPDKKRSKSQQNMRKRLNSTVRKQIHQIKHSPKLQRFHSHNQHGSYPSFQLKPLKPKAKSVQKKPKQIHSNIANNQTNNQKIIRLCEDIESMFNQAQKRLI